MGPHCTNNVVRALNSLTRPRYYDRRWYTMRGAWFGLALAFMRPFDSGYANAALLAVAMVSTALVTKICLKPDYSDLEVAAAIARDRSGASATEDRSVRRHGTGPLPKDLSVAHAESVLDAGTFDSDAWSPRAPGDHVGSSGAGSTVWTNG